jgi:L-lactate dehydrogenase (cytochrome)
MPHRLKHCYALEDFEALARRKLPRLIHGFVAGGAETEAGIRDNRASFQEYALVPRVLRAVQGRSQQTSLFGQTYTTPFGIAPMGAAALCGYRADIDLARAAAKAGLPMVGAGAGLISFEEIRKAGTTAWAQLYIPGDATRIEPLIDRLGIAGYDTMVVTVDVNVPANRENNLRNGFRLPIVPTPRVMLDCALNPGWLLGTFMRTLLTHGMPHFENMDATRGPPIFSSNQVRNTAKRDELSWEHMALIRRRWQGKLVIKGILSREDARIAREIGMDGIILSNHGGRQLDGAIAPLRVLPEIAADSGQFPVMVDGGVRRGSDVLKALALGARFVFIGRPMLFAAAVAGEAGVAHAIALMKAEIDRDLALMGVRSLSELSGDHLQRITGQDRWSQF